MAIHCIRRVPPDMKVCGHYDVVDLETVRAKYGAELRVSDFVAMSRCGKCGGRYPDVEIRVTPRRTGPRGGT